MVGTLDIKAQPSTRKAHIRGFESPNWPSAREKNVSEGHRELFKERYLLKVHQLPQHVIHMKHRANIVLVAEEPKSIVEGCAQHF